MSYIVGLVDLFPDFATRPDYADPALACFPLFLAAPPTAFSTSGYAGPLPATLPPGGSRSVADFTAILLAGYCIGSDPRAEHDADLSHSISDAAQVAVLVRRYPEAAIARDTLIDWLPDLLREVAPAVDAVADALRAPSAAASGSFLGLEDLDGLHAGFAQEVWWVDARRRLDAEVRGLAWLVEHRKWVGFGNRAA